MAASVRPGPTVAAQAPVQPVKVELALGSATRPTTEVALKLALQVPVVQVIADGTELTVPPAPPVLGAPRRWPRGADGRTRLRAGTRS